MPFDWALPSPRKRSILLHQNGFVNSDKAKANNGGEEEEDDGAVAHEEEEEGPVDVFMYIGMFRTAMEMVEEEGFAVAVHKK